MKETHPGMWMDNHIKAHKFFSDFVYDQSAPWEAEELAFVQTSMF